MSQYIKQSHQQSSATGPAQRGPSRSGMAVTSMVLGILSLPLFFCFGGLLALVSIILGCIAISSISKSKGMITGGGMAWTGVILSTVTLVFVVIAIATDGFGSLEPGEEAGAPPAHRSKLRQAESNISSSRGEKIGFGNTAEAEAIADQFATKYKEIREEAFTSTGGGISITGGNFLTHCEMNEDTCAFLVHVPRLRKFDSEAKKALCDIAWMIAQSTLAETDFPEGGQLAVGIKGVLLYENIYFGKHHKVMGDDIDEMGISDMSSDDGDLRAFFPEDPVEEVETKTAPAPAAAAESPSPAP